MEGRRVNAMGYLIDGNGNIVDKVGNQVFKHEILNENGDIPRVFKILQEKEHRANQNPLR